MKNKLKNLKVDFVSLVRKGANKKSILWKSEDAKEKPDFEKKFQISKTDEEKRIVYGIVYSPDEVDTQGDYADAATIEKAAWDFQKAFRSGNVDKNHQFEKEEAFVAETWIQKEEKGFLEQGKKGAWCVAIKIENDELWEEVKKGEIGGISLAGEAERVPAEKQEKSAEDKHGVLEKAKTILDRILKTQDEKEEGLGTEITKIKNELEKMEKALEDSEKTEDKEENPDLKEIQKTLENIEKKIHTKRSTTVDKENIQKNDFADLIVADSGERLEKSITTAEAQRVGGALVPAAAKKMVDFLVGDDLLAKDDISVVTSSRLKLPLDMFELGSENLVRVDQGTEPTSDEQTSFSNTGKTLDMVELNLFANIPFRTIWDQKDNPQFENEKAQQFLKVFRDDLNLLAWRGVADDYSGSAFYRLAKGFYQLASDSDDTEKVNIADYTSGTVVNWPTFLAALVAALPAKWKSKLATIYINQSDYEKYVTQIGSMDGAATYLITGEIDKFLGYKLRPNRYTEENKPMFTPSKNLVFGINTNIERYREIRGTKRVIDYTFTMNVDFQIGFDSAVAIGYTE